MGSNFENEDLKNNNPKKNLNKIRTRGSAQEQYFSRWYDKDPVLSMSMRTLANSSDERQIAVALNLIKVIIEHNIQDNKFENVEDIMSAVEDGRIQRGHSRWYDIDSTVRTAIQMLEKCSPETKKKVALDMAQIVIEKIIQDEDEDELRQEEDEQNTKTEENQNLRESFAKSLKEFEGKEIDLDLDFAREDIEEAEETEEAEENIEETGETEKTQEAKEAQENSENQ